MIKPKALTQFLEGAVKSFTYAQNVFISSSSGALLASTVISDTDNIYIASFTNIWSDYLELAKAKLSTDDNNPVNLNFAILDYEKGKVVLSSICGELLLGVYASKEKDVGPLMSEFKVLKEVLETNLQKVYDLQNEDNNA
eukprot:CAMPEP_0176430772 /NCGR_PEP_ID=MMETSP0127-20121128/14438_1 /TAXON_ID=938130 /ORGANISM="Platyophrya macrostoma, Strain WH" /LENGTH=139 /DNA_ID=CAMNT_0017812697 /DNA_START=35 /DNA_END=454 /DNA_ORIENTATION=+